MCADLGGEDDDDGALLDGGVGQRRRDGDAQAPAPHAGGCGEPAMERSGMGCSS